MKKDNDIVLRKVSLASLDNFALPTIKSKKEKEEDEAPKDCFFYVDILFLLMGLMHYIPYSFFITANAYWMYKFRNIDADITDTSARTWLQTHFSPVNNINNMIFGPLTVLVTTFFGYRIKARLRVLVVLALMSTFFLAGTCFVKINTDSWQVLFFVITISILVVISIANAALSTVNLSILARFPHRYMKLYLIGQGFGGICSALLQILSLALGTSTETSALFYFVSGSFLMTLTFILFFSSKYSKLFQYHANSVVEDVSKEVMAFSEAKAIAKQIWAPITAFIIMYVTLSPITPNITSLVVSEHYGSGSDWSDKYFVPVITFLFSEIMGLMGRITSSKINKTFDGIPLCICMFLRMLIIVPLVYSCNAQPRYHLPLLLSHDWEYILVIAIYNFSSGYIISMVYLDIAHLVGPEKVEDAYLVMLSIVQVAVVLCVPIGMFSVDIL